jgi:response regulator RpfG family c-di-GMP phosphodiesterase
LLELSLEFIEYEWKIIKYQKLWSEVALIVEVHHERYDRKEYPHGIMGEEIL